MFNSKNGKKKTYFVPSSRKIQAYEFYKTTSLIFIVFRSLIESVFFRVGFETISLVFDYAIKSVQTINNLEF